MKLDNRLSTLKLNQPKDNADQKLQQVAKSYEKHFLREMVKAMRTSLPDSSLIKKSMGEKLFTEKLDEQYVEQWADSGGIGLADLIYQDVREKIFGGSQAAATEQELPKVFMPMEGDSSENKIPIQMKEKEEGFEIQWENKNSDDQSKIQSPLNGRLSEHIVKDRRHYLRLSHDEFGSSILSFEGEAGPTKKGSSIEAQQELGRVDHGTGPVLWRWIRSKA